MSNFKDWRFYNGKEELSSWKISKEENIYLKRIVMTAKNKYVEKNYDYINNHNLNIDELNLPASDSIIDEVIEKYEDELISAIEFENVFNNPKLINIVGALSLKERKVLFYLHKQKKTLNEIAKIMNYSPKTIIRTRDKAYETIAEKLINGGFRYV